MAFGDSITAGEISLNPTMLLLDPSRAYPADLMGLLSSYYTAQSFSVFNEGISGETAVQGAERISDLFVRRNPEVLLLLEGVNDINAQEPDEDRVGPLLDALKFDIRDAQRRNVKVFISTLLPQKSGGSRAHAVDLIEPVNSRIRALAAAEGVTLVDSWQVFKGQEQTLIGQDGLHPTPEGYQLLAQTFFDAIKAKLDDTPVPGTVRTAMASRP
jgi:lysophospholipase L1-like esterase